MLLSFSIMTKRIHLFAITLLSPLLLALFCSGVNNNNSTYYFVVDAQSPSNINGVHTVYAINQYANCTSFFCFLGPNWGLNGKHDLQLACEMGESKSCIAMIFSYLTTMCFTIVCCLRMELYSENVLQISPYLLQEKSHDTMCHPLLGQFSWQVKVTFSQSGAPALPTLSNTMIGINYEQRPMWIHLQSSP